MPLLSPLLILILITLQTIFSRYFFQFLFLLTKSQGLATRLFAVIMLPGTILHELSHWLVAEILQVPTGKIDYMPKVEGNNIRMGSVQIAQVDPFRRTLVGIAPMISGIAVIMLLVNLLPLQQLTLPQVLADFSSHPPLFLYLYLIFIIANTMFSSRKDLEAAIVPAIFILFFIFIWYKTGFWGNDFLITQITPYLEKINYILILIIALDILIILLVKILTFVSGKILHRRIIRK